MRCHVAGSSGHPPHPPWTNPTSKEDGDLVTWHGMSLWATGLAIATLIVWTLLRGRLRAHQYYRVAEELGFTYLSRTVPETLDLARASFWNSWDLATNVILGAFKGIETAAFHFHANHGEVGYKQTTVA